MPGSLREMRRELVDEKYELKRWIGSHHCVLCIFTVHMARTKHCPVCEGDHFKRVIVTLPSGSDRDTDFVYCRRCLLVFYRNPESRSIAAPSIKTTELLRTMSAAVINEAMRKLPDPNLDGDDTLAIEHYVDYHGKVKIEFERSTGQSNGHTWRFWAAKTASKLT